MKNHLILCAAIVLTGCTSMFTHISYSDEDIRGNARNIALFDSCSANGITSTENVENFKSAFAQLLTVAVYDEKVFANSYNQTKAQLENGIPNNLETRCREFDNIAVRLIEKLNEKYSSISRQRRQDIGTLIQSANSYQPPKFNYQPQTPSLVQPSFGLSQPSTSHYLVDTGKGQRLCSISSSGVAMCQ